MRLHHQGETVKRVRFLHGQSVLRESVKRASWGYQLGYLSRFFKLFPFFYIYFQIIVYLCTVPMPNALPSGREQGGDIHLWKGVYLTLWFW